LILGEVKELCAKEMFLRVLSVEVVIEKRVVFLKLLLMAL
jgi:hypothetical protein